MAPAFALPTIVSLLVVRGVSGYIDSRYLAAFALGIYLWFFSDTMGGSAYLDANTGFNGGAPQVELLLLFAFGILLTYGLDRQTFQSSSGSNGANLGIPLLVAFAVAIHGMGEGAAFSGVAAATPANDILSAFGGISPAIAFAIHKTLEPVMVGAAYAVYAKGHASSLSGVMKDMAMLALIFIAPGLLGAATGYWLKYDTTYVFAFGLGTSLYVLVRLANPLFAPSGNSKWISVKTALAILLGFLSLYFAALFHA